VELVDLRAPLPRDLGGDRLGQVILGGGEVPAIDGIAPEYDQRLGIARDGGGAASPAAARYSLIPSAVRVKANNAWAPATWARARSSSR
jgi:hypothetical protein